MSRFTGPQYKGAMRDLRRVKRAEAEARNAEARPQFGCATREPCPYRHSVHTHR